MASRSDPRRDARAPAASTAGRWRQMHVGDLDAVMALETQAYSHPWTRGNFIDSLAAGYRAEVLLDDAGGGARLPAPALWGYSLAMAGVDETHLLNLTVAPAQRRRGLGLALLARVADDARRRGDHRLWLEVRASNLAAQALYRRFGFQPAGVRRNYYPADRLSREDAVVMSLDLQPPAPRAASAPATGPDVRHALD